MRLEKLKYNGEIYYDVNTNKSFKSWKIEWTIKKKKKKVEFMKHTHLKRNKNGMGEKNRTIKRIKFVLAC